MGNIVRVRILLTFLHDIHLSTDCMRMAHAVLTSSTAKKTPFSLAAAVNLASKHSFNPWLSLASKSKPGGSEKAD